MKRSLAVIIPVFNEAENIITTLETISQKVKTPHTIYIVYDFDEDNTLPVVRPITAKSDNITLLKNPCRGVAGAIKEGLQQAQEEYLLVSMADMSDDYDKVDQMVELMGNGYDIVCGSRYMKGGRQIGGGILKTFLSRLAGVSLWYLANLHTHDATNSFKMYSKELISRLTLESTAGFEIGIEIVVKARALGCKITEVPCLWQDRTAGESRFRIFKWAPHYLRWYFYGIKANLMNCFK